MRAFLLSEKLINRCCGIFAWYTKAVSEVLQTNIFFFITAVAAVVVAVVLVVALVYVVRILRDVQHISQIIRQESDTFHEDIAALRASVREEGMKFKHFLTFIAALFSVGGRQGRERRRTHTSNKKEEHGE